MQTPNLQSSSRSVILLACRVQIAHTSPVLLVGSLGETKQNKSLPHQHSQSTVPAVECPPSQNLFYIYLLRRGLNVSHPCPSLFCSSFLLPSTQPITPWLCFQAKWERVSARQRAGVGVDRTTFAGDINMAQRQHQYYVCTPSFSASHTVNASPLPLSLSPSKSVLCVHSRSEICQFGWKR